MNLYRQVAIFFLIMSVIGCGGSKPSRYYLLTSQIVVPESGAITKNLQIGIGPLQFPEYLRRPQLVSFSGAHMLNLAEYDRWAEPLDQNFIRILAENLTMLIPTEQIFVYPFIGNARMDYHIIIDVRQFEMNAQSQVKLIAQWQIFKGKVDQSLISKRAEYLESVNSEDYESVIAGMSKLTASLSREISDTINSLP
jgi:uncharacterized lipoprotein YmbA